jgi:hypothetical protein
MSAQFNNMNELTSYLDAMENRVKADDLEARHSGCAHSVIAKS